MTTAWTPFEDLQPGDVLVDMLDRGTATVLTNVRPIPELADDEEGVGEILVTLTDADGNPLGAIPVRDHLLAARLVLIGK